MGILIYDQTYSGSVAAVAAGQVLGSTQLVDRLGGQWKINTVLEANLPPEEWYASQLLCQPSLNIQTGIITVYVKGLLANSYNDCVLVARVNTATNQGYEVWLAALNSGNGGQLSIRYANNTTINALAATGLLSDVTQDALLVWTITGNGTSTSMTLTYAYQSAPSTIIATLTLTNDTSAGIQTAGSWGASVNVGPSAIQRISVVNNALIPLARVTSTSRQDLVVGSGSTQSTASGITVVTSGGNA